jgi:hypothetical protein
VRRVDVYEQTEHEQIVAARAKQLGVFYRVLSDPDIIRNTYSHDMYPDIIVIDRKNNVVFIEEVETESSVTESERNHQWESYSEFGYPFNLIVPKSEEMKAKQLIKNLNVHKLYYYELTSFGIKFRQVII